MVARICTASTPLSLIAMFGCVWPGAVHPTLSVDVVVAAPLNQPLVVLQYWDDGQTVSAMTTRECQFALAYPLRFHPVWFTPTLGVQHDYPRPCVAMFAKGCRPWFAASDYGVVCCQAPKPGPYAMKAELDAEGTTWTSDWYLEHRSVVQFAAGLERIDELLARTAGVSEPERAAIYEQLAQLAEHWRDAPAFKNTVSRESLEQARRAFERRAGELKCDSTATEFGQRATPAEVTRMSVGSADPTYPD